MQTSTWRSPCNMGNGSGRAVVAAQSELGIEEGPLELNGVSIAADVRPVLSL